VQSLAEKSWGALDEDPSRLKSGDLGISAATAARNDGT
jgi:hypothetical protein